MFTDTPPRHSWLWSIAGVVLVVVLLFPVYWMVNASFQPGANAARTQWLPTSPSLAGYVDALDDQLANIGTSLVVSIGTVVLSLIIAAPAAFALSQLRTRIVDVVLVCVLVTQMIPGIVLANAFYSLFSSAGMLNSHLALIIADSTMAVPFAILVLRSFMLSLDPEVLEAATLDGAGSIRRFAVIVLPLSRNALITSAVFAFIYAWGDFLFALTLTTSSDIRPVTLGIYQYIGAQQISWAQVMASSLLASIPAIILLLFTQKYIKAGLGAGSGR